MPASRTSKSSTVATAKKSAAKKTAAKKSKPKKAVSSANKPAQAKKAAPKNTSEKRAAAKKAAVKKAVPKKAAAKKAAVKKAVVKKAAPKKAAAKKAPAAKATAKKTPSSKSNLSSVTKASSTVTPPKSKAKAKTAPVPAELPDYLTDKAWLKAQREILVEERERYTKSAKSLADEAAQLMADREPGDVQFDEESGEGDTIAVERDRDLALSAKARESVDDIDAAFARLDKGTYGICTKGGDYLPKERLEAIPEASICVQHKTAMF